ncbi:adenylyltransferase/cytidyltransferase family protein [archaeon]
MKAVFVGRFQPFHKGHLHAIEAAREQFGDVTVVVGSAQKYGTAVNPLPVGQRIEAIKRELPDVRIVTQNDVFNDREWVRQIQEKVNFDVAVTGNDWVRDCFRKFGHSVEEPEFLSPEKYNGTAIRKRKLDENP